MNIWLGTYILLGIFPGLMILTATMDDGISERQTLINVLCWLFWPIYLVYEATYLLAVMIAVLVNKK